MEHFLEVTYAAAPTCSITSYSSIIIGGELASGVDSICPNTTTRQDFDRPAATI
jgi:hypothetical protein